MLNTPNIQQPHRPGPLHQTNKTHKGGRHSKKSSVSSEIKNKVIHKPSLKLNREERLNQANQTRKLRREQIYEEKRKSGTEGQPPLTIGLLDLCSNSYSSLFNSIKNYDDKAVLSAKIINSNTMYIVSNRLKMRFKLICLDSSDFDESLDTVKSLDVLILIHRPGTVEHFDFENAKLFRAIYIHCLPTIVHLLDGLSEFGEVTTKGLTTSKRILRSMIKEDKLHCVEKQSDLLQLFHIVSNCKRIPSNFKDSRPVIISDLVESQPNSLKFTGFIKQKLLSPNDLVHIVGYGDYQIKQIDILPDIVSLRAASVTGMKVVQTLLPDSMHQETLEQENELDPMEGEQTWPTAEELAAEAERMNTKRYIKRLPPGTSEYQGAWIPEDSDEEDQHSDSSPDDDGDTKMKDTIEEDEVDKFSDTQSQEDANDMGELCSENIESSELAMDVDDYDKIHPINKESKILEKLKEARLEEMFPDEIDTPSDVPARIRFARYRGLKSFRTSAWDPQENLPPEYSRIFQFQNFHQTKRRVLSERTKDGADPGQYVCIHLANVPEEVAASILKRSQPPTLVGLLKYERKMTVMNLLIKRHQDSDLSNPVKSKDELIFYVGFRKFKARPLFTTHSISSKFKYERFLRDDVAMVATIYAPITFPPAPVLVFRENHKNEKNLIASGTVLDSNPNRLIIKRIRLSGHPFKIHSKSAVVRFMFFNSEDVNYFKPVELTSKYNRRGHITEPLGTHGHMKCTFDKKIRSDDCLFMNLYKRVFPKWTYSPINSF